MRHLALTIRQPWAWAIFEAGKDIENRTWKPTNNVIGSKVYIHTSQLNLNINGKSKKAIEFRRDLEFIRDVIASKDSSLAVSTEYLLNLFRDQLTPATAFGSIIGSVEFDSFLTESENPWHIDGQIGWHCTTPQLLDKPIITKGQLGLWDCTHLVGKNK